MRKLKIGDRVMFYGGLSDNNGSFSHMGCKATVTEGEDHRGVIFLRFDERFGTLPADDLGPYQVHRIQCRFLKKPRAPYLTVDMDDLSTYSEWKTLEEARKEKNKEQKKLAIYKRIK